MDAMNIVILHESMFGNTRQIAEAIAQGALEAAPGADVACLAVTESDPDRVQAAELLVVGGPTHIRGMSSAMTRKMGLSAEEKKPAEEQHETEPGAAGPGVRDWFDDLPEAAKGTMAAAFDTRAEAKFAGGAAHGIARRLRRHGYTLVGEPEGFIIEDIEGPLRTGELERAQAWGAELVRQAGQ
jgi:Flavodoxin